MSVTFITALQGVAVEVTATYAEAVPATRDEPGEPETVELVSVTYCGLDLTGRLTAAEYEDMEAKVRSYAQAMKHLSEEDKAQERAEAFA